MTAIFLPSSPSGVMLRRNMSCKERAQLLHRYEKATSDYARAVLDLRESSVATGASYEAMFQAADKARKTAESARAALQDHSCIHCR